MSEARTVGTLSFGKGCVLVFKVDDSQSPDSIDHRWSEASYDGADDSDVPEIGAHWHKHHDEYMRVERGQVSFTLDGKTSILTPSDPPLKIPRLHVHSFKFIKGVPSMFTERTDPVGEFKKDFFEDLLDTGTINFAAAMRSFYYGDTYIALPGGFRLLDQAVTLTIGGCMAFLFPQKNKGMLAESMGKQPETARL